MLVCVCKRVSDSMIHDAYEEGIQSVESLGQHLGLGQCCGKCKPYAQQVLDTASKNTSASGVQMWSPAGASTLNVWNPAA
ncbi:bacterioferritin-associated ferredoxin [Pokkaliibacter sp. CJK22405]|uniref:(2Fe-2S)-binding protein n=1 Tax=Pokkaliibacter sp. CJK22405 TaxID=3384615 RepID=UPI0039849172